jgi:hypothetical protein
LCLAMLMEKTGKLKKTYAIRPKKFNIWQRWWIRLGNSNNET